MGIDNITSKIICEAGQKADDILTNARVAGDAIIAEAENKADRMLETAEKNGRIEKEADRQKKECCIYRRQKDAARKKAGNHKIVF